MRTVYISGLASAALALIAPVSASRAATAAPVPALSAPTYSDLVELADSAPIILKAEIRTQATVEPARAGSVAPGRARVYFEAAPLGLVRGSATYGRQVAYLADVPLDAKGKVPNLKKRVALLFVAPVSGLAPGMIHLAASDGQVLVVPGVEARLATVMAELAAPDAPGRITGVREALYVPGDLVGEGETQIFLNTANGGPASISVEHRPGQPASWSASFSEVVDATGHPPLKDTLPWHRLACSLPASLPDGVNVSQAPADRDQASADYRLVRDGLGPCGRSPH